MKVALYARVSTPDQSPELQLAAMRNYCAVLRSSPQGPAPWLISKEYVDCGVSGAKGSRPALDQLMSDAAHRKFQAVLVWKFDRFARSIEHLVRALSEFQALGIDFISLTETIDTTTPMGKMVFIIMGALAEFERDLIRERVRAGIQAARARGKRLGRPNVAVDAAALIELRKTRSWREIRDLTGIARSTALRAIKRVSKNVPKMANGTA